MNEFKIYNKDEPVYEMWGLEEYKLTKEDIEALLDGKKLYNTINQEYAFTIILSDSKDGEDDE